MKIDDIVEKYSGVVFLHGWVFPLPEAAEEAKKEAEIRYPQYKWIVKDYSLTMETK